MTNKNLRFGVLDPETFASMSGIEFLQGMIDGDVPGPPIAKELSFWITEVGKGYVIFEGNPGHHLLNPGGTVHGGWALTLIDSVTGCACQSLLPAGQMFTTVETKGNFSRPITPDTGLVEARADVITNGRRIVTTEARITSKKTGKVLAHGTSTLIIL
jgi:uncharacterized protein (TIGR00369 family)